MLSSKSFQLYIYIIMFIVSTTFDGFVKNIAFLLTLFLTKYKLKR